VHCHAGLDFGPSRQRGEEVHQNITLALHVSESGKVSRRDQGEKVGLIFSRKSVCGEAGFEDCCSSNVNSNVILSDLYHLDICYEEAGNTGIIQQMLATGGGYLFGKASTP
jgi:hypothetical protein